jgi:2,3,4,5-tetrahydropyridine-2-carboxylate N-succinyltransferase
MKINFMASINVNLIEKAWEDRSLLNDPKIQDEINKTIDALDKGMIRVAEPGEKGWIVNQ